MIRELDQSKLSIRLIEQSEKEGKNDKDQYIARLGGPTLSTLQNCLVRNFPISITENKEPTDISTVPPHSAYPPR